MHIIPIKAYQDNYIWMIINENKRQAMVVDPGEATGVLNYLHAQQLGLAAIWVTHHHADHCYGIAELQRHFAVPVYGPQHSLIPATVTVEAGSRIQGVDWDIDFEVMALPGHTLTHVAYYAAKQRWLFCGDTLFSAGCGRLFEGTAQQMWSSLMGLAALPDDTRVYCAHEYTLANCRFAIQVEPANQVLQSMLGKTVDLRQRGQVTLPSIIAIEKQINPFLRCQQAAVIEAASAFHGAPLHEPHEVFAALRRWKDVFNARF